MKEKILETEIALVLDGVNIYKYLHSNLSKQEDVYFLHFATHDYLFYFANEDNVIVLETSTKNIITTIMDKAMELIFDIVENEKEIIYGEENLFNLE